MRDINNYEVYKTAHQFTLQIYEITKGFPKEEIYGLVSQMRRAAYSIPMNLKEGSGGTEPQFFRYVKIAIGSKDELEYQLLLAKDLGYISETMWKKMNDTLASIGRMLFGILDNPKK